MAGAQSAWGVDVGVSSMKAIKLKKDGGRVTIEAFEVIEHDKFLSEPDVDRDALIRSTLQKFMMKYGLKREAVFIGVPGSTTFARFVKLPPVETKKIPEIVRFEAIQQIPFPLDQVNWDYHTFQHPDSPDVEVGIFAMKKELIAQILSNFRAVEMPVTGVQMSPLAVYNAAAYDNMTDDKGTVVIDMGAEHTDLVVLDQGRLWLRTINIGGNHFTEALAKSFKQPFARAETLKKTAATSKYQKQIYQAMRPIFADLVAEIQRSIGHYNSSHRDSRLERIVGMGNPFKLPNLQKYLQQELKMDVVRLESYNNANVEKAAAFSENILSMSAAYGLALQALGHAQINTNLLPTEIARKMMWRHKQPWFIASAAVVALGAASIIGSFWLAKTAFASTENEQKKNQNNATFNDAKLLEDKWKGVSTSVASAQTQVDAQMKLVAARTYWPAVMDDIYQSLPQAKPGSTASVVINDMSSTYYAKIASVSTAAPTSPTMGMGGGPGAPGQGMPDVTAGTPAPPAAGGAPAAGATPAAADERGYLLTLTGYSQSSDFKVVAAFASALVARAPEKGPKPYYFSSPTYPGHLIKATAPAAGTGSAGFGAGGSFGGMTPQANTGSTSASDRPWGNVKGPYWDAFVPDMTGLKATVPPGGAGMGSTAPVMPELPAIDLVATRAGSTPTLKPIDNVWTFVLKVRLHIKNDVKAEPAK